MTHSRLGCSTISFRHQPLDQALSTIAGLGFTEIDLGALPGVCDHVPHPLDAQAVAQVAETVAASGLEVRSINCDIGDLNVPLDSAGAAARRRHLDALVDLAVAVGSTALVLPCGALDRQPVADVNRDLDLVATELITAANVAQQRGIEIWTESLHYYRLCWRMGRAQRLTDRLVDSPVRVVMDFSHIVASCGDPVEFVGRFHRQIAHVHLRDAVPGNINLSLRRGSVDFPRGLKALADAGYTGHFALELETRDVTHDQRPAATAHAAQFISDLI